MRKAVRTALIVSLAGWLACVAFALGGQGPAENSPRALAERVRQSQLRDGLAPILSADRADFDMPQAMAVQDELVRMWLSTDPIAGYKAAFNAVALQQRFGVSAPAVGVLHESAQSCVKRQICRIGLGSYHKPALEIEIAIRLAAPITEAPQSRAQLLSFVAAIMPAVELPELALSGNGVPRGVDFIASNIGVRKFILGDAQPASLLLGPGLPMSLRSGSVTLLQGDSSAALDAALVLVRQVLDRGYTLEKGQILLTGAVGGLHPGVPGDYVADYGKLGSLRFSVR